MITGVPSFAELSETAANWMNLAWSLTIECLSDVEQWRRYQKDGGLDPDALLRQEAKQIRAQRYRITNGFSLHQQSLELFLKARIAEVSPFLLISGDQRTWPKPKPNENLDFTELRTIDATELCKVVNTVSATPVSSDFVQLFDDLRKQRNKIIHLDTGNVVFQSTAILLNILKTHRELFPNELWQQFRTSHLQPRPPSDDDDIDYDFDFSHNSLMNEIAILLENLEPALLRKFLGVNTRREFIECPTCKSWATKYYGGSTRFAQISADGSVYCVACLTRYADSDTYDKAAEEYL